MPKSVFTDAYTAAIALLVSARRNAGVSQVELAARLGKPQQFVSRVERSERRIDVVEFCAIARALGVDPGKLFQDLLRVLPEKLVI